MSSPLAFQLGRFLVIGGIVLLALGLVFIVASKYSPLLPASLPGDIVYKGKNFRFYFPIVTSLILSGLITLLWWIFSLLTRK